MKELARSVEDVKAEEHEGQARAVVEAEGADGSSEARPICPHYYYDSTHPLVSLALSRVVFQAPIAQASDVSLVEEAHREGTFVRFSRGVVSEATCEGEQNLEEVRGKGLCRRNAKARDEGEWAEQVVVVHFVADVVGIVAAVVHDVAIGCDTVAVVVGSCCIVGVVGIPVPYGGFVVLVWDLRGEVEVVLAVGVVHAALEGISEPVEAVSTVAEGRGSQVIVTMLMVVIVKELTVLAFVLVVDVRVAKAVHVEEALWGVVVGLVEAAER